MESNKILGADILDILFDGRNKEYGAYELRKTYNGRLGRAMVVTGFLILGLFMCGFVVRKGERKVKTTMFVSDPYLLPAPEPAPPPPPPPPPKPSVPQV